MMLCILGYLFNLCCQLSLIINVADTDVLNDIVCVKIVHTATGTDME